MNFKVFILVSLSLMQTANAFEALPIKAPYPKDNPTTIDKVELGKHLFFDPRLSRTGNISCNSCHNVMGGGEDGRPNSVGILGQLGGRSAPTVWNAAYMSVQFWDGRAASLEDQAKGPMTNPIEMGMSSHDVVAKTISEIPGYQSAFAKVYKTKQAVTIENIAKAIAAYERTLVTPNSPYDKFVQGNKLALSSDAQRGLSLVQTIGCTGCHSGANFAGPSLPVGQGFFQKFPIYSGSLFEKKYHFTEDLGRYQVTKNDADKNLWRVPTWRNIALTAPYFHNGSVKTLDEAVRVMAKTQLDKDLNDRDVHSIVSFLESLTGEFPKQTMPRLPPTLGLSLNGSEGKTSPNN